PFACSRLFTGISNGTNEASSSTSIGISTSPFHVPASTVKSSPRPLVCTQSHTSIDFPLTLINGSDVTSHTATTSTDFISLGRAVNTKANSLDQAIIPSTGDGPFVTRHVATTSSSVNSSFNASVAGRSSGCSYAQEVKYGSGGVGSSGLSAPSLDADSLVRQTARATVWNRVLAAEAAAAARRAAAEQAERTALLTAAAAAATAASSAAAGGGICGGASVGGSCSSLPPGTLALQASTFLSSGFGHQAFTQAIGFSQHQLHLALQQPQHQLMGSSMDLMTQQQNHHFQQQQQLLRQHIQLIRSGSRFSWLSADVLTNPLIFGLPGAPMVPAILKSMPVLSFPPRAQPHLSARRVIQVGRDANWRQVCFGLGRRRRQFLQQARAFLIDHPRIRGRFYRNNQHSLKSAGCSATIRANSPIDSASLLNQIALGIRQLKPEEKEVGAELESEIKEEDESETEDVTEDVENKVKDIESEVMQIEGKAFSEMGRLVVKPENHLYKPMNKKAIVERFNSGTNSNRRFPATTIFAANGTPNTRYSAPRPAKQCSFNGNTILPSLTKTDSFSPITGLTVSRPSGIVYSTGVNKENRRPIS
ncbi:unnamed protein product, partial [Protopolystoma xenopodis]